MRYSRQSSEILPSRLLADLWCIDCFMISYSIFWVIKFPVPWFALWILLKIMKFNKTPRDKQLWSWAWIILGTPSKLITCLLFYWQNLRKILISFSSEFVTCPDILQKIQASEKKKFLFSFTLNLQKWKATAVSEPEINKKHVAGGTMHVHLIAS